MTDLVELTEKFYRAFEAGDRAWTEAQLAESYTFTSPFDDRIDKATMFARCWANRGMVGNFQIEAIARDGDRVMVVYSLPLKSTGTHPGISLRNAEYLTFENGKLKSTEVFFGDAPAGLSKKQFAEQCGAG